MAWTRSFLNRTFLATAWLILAMLFLVWRYPGFWNSPYDHFRNARDLLSAERLDEAGEEADLAVQADPLNAGYRIMAGNVRLRSKQYPVAELLFRRALELAPGDVEAGLGLAAALSAQSKAAEALQAMQGIPRSSLTDDQRHRLSQAYALSGDFASALREGDLLVFDANAPENLLRERLDWAMAANDWEEAVRTGERLASVTRQPGQRESARNRVAVALRALGRMASALAMLRQVPEDGNLEARAELAVQLQQFREAVGLYQQLIRSEPDNVDAQMQLAYALMKSGRNTEAEAIYQRMSGELGAEDRMRFASLLNSRGEYARAWRILSPLPRPSGNTELLTTQARTALWAGRLDDAVLLFRALHLKTGIDTDSETDLAFALQNEGRLPEAEEFYAAIIRSGAPTMLTRVRFAWLLNDQKRYREAWSALEPLDRPSNETSALEVQAKTAFWASEDQAAQPTLRAWLTRRPDDSESWGFLAESYRRSGNTADQIVALRAYTGLRPSDSAAKLSLAGLLEQRDDPSEALSLYRDVIEVRPSDPRALAGYANMMERAGEPRQAIPYHIRTWQATGEQDFVLARRIAELIRNNGEPLQSIPWYERYLANETDLEQRRSASGQLALAELESGSPDGALQRLEPLVAGFPAESTLLVTAARAATAASKPDRAIAHLEKLARQRSLNPGEQVWLAGQYRAGSRREDALRTYEAVVAASVTPDPELVEAVGDLRADLGDFPGAIRAYEQAQRRRTTPETMLKIARAGSRIPAYQSSAGSAFELVLQQRPEWLDVHLEAARFFAGTGQPPPALRHYEAFVASRSPNGIRLELAREYLAANRFGEAERWAREAVRNGEGDSVASRLVLAQALHLNMNSSESEELLRTVLAEVPNQPEAIAQLAYIAAARNQHTRAFWRFRDAIDLGASRPEALWFWKGSSALQRGDYYRSANAFEQASRLGFSGTMFDDRQQELRKSTAPVISIPFRAYGNSNDLSLWQSGLAGTVWPGRSLSITGQVLGGRITQEQTRVSRNSVLLGLENIYVRPILRLDIAGGTESFGSAGALVVGHAAGRLQFEDESTLELRIQRGSLWTDQDLADPRQFNRVIDLSALRPDFRVQGVRITLDQSLRLRDRLRFQFGLDRYQDGNQRSLVYSHYQFPLRDGDGGWLAVRPNIFIEGSRFRSATYFSPSRYAALGTALHSIFTSPAFRLEGELNPHLILDNSRTGFGVYAVGDAIRHIGPVSLGLGSMIFYDQRNGYYLWRLSGQFRLRF